MGAVKASFEKVYSLTDKKYVTAIRQSNQTLIVSPIVSMINDTDQSMMEDKYGHRYARDISLEQFSNGFFVYKMI